MNKIALSALALLLPLAIAGATEWQVSGYHDGYATYHGSNYYWRGNDAYTRVQVLVANGYYANGYYYQPTHRWEYRFAYTHKQDYAPKAPAYGPDWKVEALKAAAQLDDYENYLKTIDTLGLSRQGRQGYGQYAYGGKSAYAGQAVYGNSFSASATLYGETDLNVLLQQYAQIVKNAQGAGVQATSEIGGVVDKLGSNQARVAEILADGQARAAMIRASHAQGAKVEVSGQGAGVKTEVTPNMPKAEDAVQLRQQWQQSAKKCASCHSGQRVEGGFNLLDLPPMPMDQRMKRVVSRLVTDDLSKRMPRNADGGVGHRLSDTEIMAWVRLPVETAGPGPDR